MRSDTWLGRFWSRLHAGVVQDVPVSLEECEMCREVECTQERWDRCERRLAAEAAHLGRMVGSTGKTDEMPRVNAPGPAQEASDANQEADDYARRRKISIH